MKFWEKRIRNSDFYFEMISLRKKKKNIENYLKFKDSAAFVDFGGGWEYKYLNH